MKESNKQHKKQPLSTTSNSPRILKAYQKPVQQAPTKSSLGHKKASGHKTVAAPSKKPSAGSGHAKAKHKNKAGGEGKSQVASRKSATSAGKRAGAGVSRSFVEASGETVCREVACEGLATTGNYCRLHYIKNWKKIKRKETILQERKLNQYIEELVAKYPDKYIEAIRQDLANDKDFAKVINDLDLDESVDDFDIEGGDSVDSLIDTIKRDFDDETDAF